jgi:hypothetical protein
VLGPDHILLVVDVGVHTIPVSIISEVVIFAFVVLLAVLAVPGIAAVADWLRLLGDGLQLPPRG